MKKKSVIVLICLFVVMCIVLGVISFLNMNTHRVFIGPSIYGASYAFYITPSSIIIQYNMHYDVLEDQRDKNYIKVDQQLKLDNKPKYIKIKLSKQDSAEISDMIKKIKNSHSYDKPVEMIPLLTEVPTYSIYADIHDKYYMSYAANNDCYDYPEYYNEDLIKLGNKLVLLVFDYLKCDVKDYYPNSIYRQLEDELW